MAKFKPIFEKVIKLEGGFILHKIEGDSGGMTYAGISRKSWPDWPGWEKIDKEKFDTGLVVLVQQFYRENFWAPIQGRDIIDQRIADHIFSFAVHAGIPIAVKLAQGIVGALEDGIFGPQTLRLLNKCRNGESFVLKYSLLQIFRYKNICLYDKRKGQDSVKSNLKFLAGWINRVEKGLDK